MRSERGSDGVWHAAELDATVTLCGRDRIPATRGRRSKVSCVECIAAGGADAQASPARLTPKPVKVPSPSPVVRPLVGEPEIPAGGGCARCGKHRHPERSAKYGGVAAQLDPFCSTGCAKAFYSIVDRFDDVEEPEEARAA